MKINLYLVRHGEPLATGANPDLSAHGRRQARALAEMLAKFIPTGDVIKILTSELARARRTASLLRSGLNVTTTTKILAAPTNTTVAPDTARLITELRAAATPNPLLEPKPQHIIAVWHLPSINFVLNQLAGGNTFTWPSIYGATAIVGFPNASLADNAGEFQWMICPLPSQ